MSPPDPPAVSDAALPDGICDCHVHVIGAPEACPMVADCHCTPGPASLETLRRHLAVLELQRAVIVQPSVYGTDNRCLLDALDCLEGAGRGVAVPSEDVAPDVVAALADRLAALPTRVVLDHFALMAHAPGVMGPGTAIEDLLRTCRVLVKLSAPYRLPPAAYRRIAHGELADALQAWRPSPDLRRPVLADTPAGLCGF